ncbi:MAG TPA: lanthionine synthetase LanC family protein, partial [Chroococcales cyanobacterium]
NPQQVAWCHGAAGIALSRLKIYEKHRLPQAKEEASKALHFLLTGPAPDEHVICHGSLGNLEPLLLAAQLFPEERIWQRQLQERGRQILNDINRRGWRSKVCSQVIEPGLMTGLAGIGYQLLRLHASDKVPSVLTLDAPVAVSAPERSQSPERPHV